MSEDRTYNKIQRMQKDARLALTLDARYKLESGC